MSYRTPLRCVFALFLLIVFLVVEPQAVNAGTTRNLLVNGNAEQMRCTDDWTAQTSVAGWRVTRGAVSVLCYSAFKLSGEQPVLPKHESAGRALFGAPGADTAMEQMVDISAAASAVDAEGVRFRLSGLFGGWGRRPERAVLTAIFLDARGRSTRNPVVMADVDARARGNVTALLRRQADGVVPKGTRRIQVRIQFISGATSYHNAYADNIGLYLEGNVEAMASAPVLPKPVATPALDHVYVVMMENTNYADVIRTRGNRVTIDPQMPFTAKLAANGVVLTNTWQTYHPSDQNYVAMVAGDTYKYGLTYFPDYDLKVRHLGDLLEAEGKTWRAYVQDMVTPCNLSSSGSGRASYSPDDEPFVQFDNVINNLSRCEADLRDLSDFKAAIAGNTLPDFAWIAADNWWDGEGAWFENYDVAFSNAMQDNFLRSVLDPLLRSDAWKNSRSLLILTWDESGGWGWPDNRVPTILVGSPGVLLAGSVVHEHVNGYDLLRTVESALRVGSLDRFDAFARPLRNVFADAEEDDLAHELWPTEGEWTRGSIDDTFGQVTTPAEVAQGQEIKLVVPAGTDGSDYVNLERLGDVPGDECIRYPFEGDGISVTIPGHLAPGIYAAWLRHRGQLPNRAPTFIAVLPPSRLSPDNPGVEILGGETGGEGAHRLTVREGSNFVVHYCLPADAAAANSWIGIFPKGTPNDQITKDNANAISAWLRTPGNPVGARCGEAPAYVSELTPGVPYEVLLVDGSDVVGQTDSFSLRPALPH
ncbi:MAG: hypothetical protein JO319_00740 [Acidobacteriaceae bacterium]|nr:hypothetical protein [Acidobacteriaceae bacterium]